MSTQTNENNQKFFEVQFHIYGKTFGFSIKANPKVVISILLPIVIKIVSMLITYYGQTCP